MKDVEGCTDDSAKPQKLGIEMIVRRKAMQVTPISASFLFLISCRLCYELEKLWEAQRCRDGVTCVLNMFCLHTTVALDTAGHTYILKYVFHMFCCTKVHNRRMLFL